jgi:hypothetical protein
MHLDLQPHSGALQIQTTNYYNLIRDIMCIWPAWHFSSHPSSFHNLNNENRHPPHTITTQNPWLIHIPPPPAPLPPLKILNCFTLPRTQRSMDRIVTVSPLLRGDC